MEIKKQIIKKGRNKKFCNFLKSAKVINESYLIIFIILFVFAKVTTTFAKAQPKIQCAYVKRGVSGFEPGSPIVTVIKGQVDDCDPIMNHNPKNCSRCTVVQCLANIVCSYNGFKKIFENINCQTTEDGFKASCPTSPNDCLRNIDGLTDSFKKEPENVSEIMLKNVIDFIKLYPQKAKAMDIEIEETSGGMSEQ